MLMNDRQRWRTLHPNRLLNLLHLPTHHLITRIQFPYPSEILSRLEFPALLDKKAGRFRQDEERGEDEQGGRHDLHGERDLPLVAGGGGEVFVGDVVAPVAHEGGELVIDFVDAD